MEGQSAQGSLFGVVVWRGQYDSRAGPEGVSFSVWCLAVIVNVMGAGQLSAGQGNCATVEQ